jgi:hypothetical protein
VGVLAKTFSFVPSDTEAKPKKEDEPVNPAPAAHPVDPVDDAETTKAEIGQRLASFQHITENTFLCERYGKI